jgi:hypothetical protein
MAYLSQWAATKPFHSGIINLTVFSKQNFSVVIHSVYTSGIVLQNPSNMS